MKLADWLNIPNPDGSKKRRRVFAAAIGVTPSMVTQYCRADDGAMWPSREKMEAIAKATQGAVTPNDFVNMEEVNQ